MKILSIQKQQKESSRNICSPNNQTIQWRQMETWLPHPQKEQEFLKEQEKFIDASQGNETLKPW